MPKNRKAAILNEKIADYFNARKSAVLDKNKEPVLDANGDPVYEYVRPLTVTGLANALGFSSREQMLAVRDQKSAEAIASALLRIEEYAEEKLFYKDSFSGTKLFLSVNFPRYQEGTQGAFESFPEAYDSWAK